MPDHCDPAPERCIAADAAADAAVRKTFAILGVDIDDPQQVKRFQDSLRFSEKLNIMADKSVTVFVLALVAAGVGAFLLGLKQKLIGG